MTAPAWLPRRVERPESARRAAELLADLGAAGQAAIPRGHGTKLALGMPPRAADVVIETTALAGIVKHDPDDLVVTVRAGTRFADLQRELATFGQHVPLDPPHSAATVGGVVATASAGPRRATLGAPRDHVIGIEVAYADGRVGRAGGRVVKNVTGYDLMKLHTGALGTLGLVTEVTLRLRTRTLPAAASSMELATLDEATERLERADFAIVVGPREGRFTVVEGEPHPDRGEELTRSAQLAARARLDVPRTSVATTARALLEAADGVDAIIELRQDARAMLYVRGAHPSAFLEYVAAVRKRVPGLVTWEELPDTCKHDVGVWPDPGSALGLMRELKRTLDPKGVLNPGRFVGGV